MSTMYSSQSFGLNNTDTHDHIFFLPLEFTGILIWISSDYRESTKTAHVIACSQEVKFKALGAWLNKRPISRYDMWLVGARSL